MRQQVINVRGFSGNRSDVVYVGRYCAGWPQHQLANPYRLPKNATFEQRDECLVKYLRWLGGHTPDALMHEIDLLRRATNGGQKPLGCWCHPLQCHADFLAELCEEFPACPLFKLRYPRLWVRKVSVFDPPTPHVRWDDLHGSLSGEEQKQFEELFGIQTCYFDGPYAHDVEAVLERMATGKLVGSQADWD